ncbi:MAG: spermine synthase [Methylococcaceae bacterium]|nr:spermine synthase [Methylococcaceae bacterium]
MYRYAGHLIHESHDDDGIIEVIEAQGVRSLHFGSSSRQSSMRLNDPEQLELAYIRAMMSWLFFKDTPENTLVIGLGGGSLTKYLLNHYADIKITVVEYRKSVVKIARSHFDLPFDARLKIIVDDGGDYVRKRAESTADSYNLLFLDAFDHEGMAESVRSEAFFDACKNVLTSDGIMVLNLWGTDKALFEQVTWCLGRIFKWRLLFLPVPDKGNIICLAFGESAPVVQMKALQKRAIELEEHYHLDFSGFLKEFKRNNTHTLNKIIV